MEVITELGRGEELSKMEVSDPESSLIEEMLTPPELLQNVLSFLPSADLQRACLVCRRWRDVAYSSKSLWKHRVPKLDLNSGFGRSVLKSLTSRGIKSVQILSCRNQRTLNKLLISELAHFTSINLSGSTLSEFDRPYSLSTLYSLNLSLCKTLDEFNLARIIYNATNLTSLDLGGCSSISDKGLLLIRARLGNLRVLNLRSGSFGDKGIGWIAAGGKEASEEFAPFLQAFSRERNQPIIPRRKYSLYHQSHSFNHPGGIYHEIALMPAPPPPQTDHQIQHQPQTPLYYGIFSETNAKIAMLKHLGSAHLHHQQQQQQHPMSKQICVAEPMRMYTASVPSTPQPKAQSRKRDSSGNTKYPDLALTEPAPLLRLTSLNLQDCQKITDSCLQSINTISTLTSLNLSFCLSITDNGLKFLTLPLQELNFRSCENITSGGLKCLRLEGSLTDLDLSFNDKITDLSKISHLRLLKKLALSACPIDHTTGIRFLCLNNVNLHSLHIGQCKGVTDESLQEISKSLPLLEFIDLYGCMNVGTAGIEHLMKNLKKLEKINLGLWDLKAKL